MRPAFRRSVFILCTLVLLSSKLVGTALGQTWPDEHVSGRFVFHADFKLHAYHNLLQTVTTLEKDVPETLGIGSPKEPVHVFLFKKKSTYQGYVQRYFPGVPIRPALFIKQRGPGMVFARVSTDFDVDLRHETTHAVLHGALPMVPLWLDEGLAEYFEVPESQRTRHPHLRAVQAKTRWGRVPKLHQLETLSDISQMQSQHYRDAWAWVHFMLHGPPEAKQTLMLYLHNIESHIPPGQLSELLQRRVPNLNERFVSHFRTWKR